MIWERIVPNSLHRDVRFCRQRKTRSCQTLFLLWRQTCAAGAHHKGPVGSTGCLVVGSEGTLSAGLWNTDCNIRLSDASDFQGANQPEVIKIAKTQSRIDTEVLKWDPKRAAKENVRDGAK